ncbi:uncharacterized protein LOC119080911 [Bradysia coprophila]|uniref:uncharacterized protein LOC119080911 n=1 Tax=Bradysia coprophila TaxID=38358 RepID=UPI00187D7093|nr:uncharacterized protein LOC119080911 [Bradysia coprophila]
MNKACFIDGCSAYKEKNTSFHRFPNDPKICKSWCESIIALNKQENAFSFRRNSYVCGHHFTSSDKYDCGGKTKLYRKAVPSLYPQNCETEPVHNDPRGSETEPVVAVEGGETNKILDESSNVPSDQEDFLGFNTDDLRREIIGRVEPENDTSLANPSDSNEIDDEIIFVENTVEVIEIDDEDDNEVPQPAHIEQDKKPLSKYEIQQMVISNHPQVQLVKPKLDWKSDQFRLVYINGKNQNYCTCTKCWELFDEINIDTVVRHAKCNPTPSVSPCGKRKKLNLENVTGQELDITGASREKVTTSKIQIIAACMDVQTSTFYQREKFLQFAQFLVDTGATYASANKHKFEYELKYEALCSFGGQLKDMQSSKIQSIFNDSTVDFSLSCEVWEDIFRSKTNISLELHYLDENFLSHRVVIGVRSISGIGIEDSIICDRILDILNIYTKENNGAEILERATAFVTSRRLDTESLRTTCFPSACSIINEVANGIINDNRLKIAEKCLHVIGWLNAVCTERITEFDARKWENIFELFKRFTNKKTSFIQRAVDATFPQDTSTLQLLEPFHSAIVQLTEAGNNITKVFGIYKQLENNLTPLECDERTVKLVKRKAVSLLRTAFADSETYQICMFLDPSNRDQYNSLESDKMDNLQSKIDLMINPHISKENGRVENDLMDFMDDNVTSQANQIDLFLQWSVPSKHNPYEFWRDNKQMPGLRALARKYFSIPSFVSRVECKFSKDAVEFLSKRSKLDVKDLEAILMMNSSEIDVDLINVK